jgi:hypothetical protein
MYRIIETQGQSETDLITLSDRHQYRAVFDTPTDQEPKGVAVKRMN